MGRMLLDIQGILGEDNPGIIGVEMVAGKEGDAAEVDAHVAFADTFTCGPDGDSRQRLDAEDLDAPLRERLTGLYRQVVAELQEERP